MSRCNLYQARFKEYHGSRQRANLLHRSSENDRGLEKEPRQQRVSHGRGLWFIKGLWLYQSQLLGKLKAYGLSQSALSLMSSYLLGRKQRVCLHSVCSSYSELRAGLPQGSLLGPLLFNIFIYDLNYVVPDVSLRLYADDTTLYASDVSLIALQFVVNPGLSYLSEWFDANYLLINNAKTPALPIGSRQYDFDLILSGSGVTTLPPIRIFGVELDSMLRGHPCKNQTKMKFLWQGSQIQIVSSFAHK